MGMMTTKLVNSLDIWRHDGGISSLGQPSTHYTLLKAGIPCRAEKKQVVRYDSARATSITQSFWVIALDAGTDIADGDIIKNLQSADGVVMASNVIVQGTKEEMLFGGFIDHLVVMGFDYEDPASLVWPPPGL